VKKLAYTVEEAIKASGVKRDLLYHEINRGNLRTLKVGRRRLVRVEALEQWLKEHEARTSQAMGLADSTA
jgi:excisionase family DNA binding protein